MKLIGLQDERRALDNIGALRRAVDGRPCQCEYARRWAGRMLFVRVCVKCGHTTPTGAAHDE